jgi:hypothetical protein
MKRYDRVGSEGEDLTSEANPIAGENDVTYSYLDLGCRSQPQRSSLFSPTLETTHPRIASSYISVHDILQTWQSASQSD